MSAVLVLPTLHSPSLAKKILGFKNPKTSLLILPLFPIMQSIWDNDSINAFFVTKKVMAPACIGWQLQPEITVVSFFQRMESYQCTISNRFQEMIDTRPASCIIMFMLHGLVFIIVAIKIPEDKILRPA